MRANGNSRVFNYAQVNGLALHLLLQKRRGKTITKTATICVNGHCGRSKCSCGGRSPTLVANYEPGPSPLEGREHGIVNRTTGLPYLPSGEQGDALLTKAAADVLVSQKETIQTMTKDTLVAVVSLHLKTVQFDLPMAFDRVWNVFDSALEQARERVKRERQKEQDNSKTIRCLVTAVTLVNDSQAKSLKRHDQSDERHDQSDKRHDKSDERHDISDWKHLESTQEISALKDKYEELKSQIQPLAAMNPNSAFSAACPVTSMGTPAFPVTHQKP